MTAIYDLSGRTSLVYDGRDARAAAYLAKQMDPFPAGGEAGPPGVVIGTRPPGPRRLADIQNPARDAVTTACDGEQFCLLVGDRTCTVPWPLDRRPLRFECDPGFPVARIFRRLVRPALQLALHERDAAAVHAASVELDGGAVLIAGWSESGKTETALALMEQGAAFLSDKWTIVGADGGASAFPIDVGVRGWVLPYLPRLAAALPGRARTRLAAAGVAAAVAKPARGRVGALAARAVAVADRAALTPSEVRAAYEQEDDAGRRVPVAATAVLTTVPGPEVTCEPADAGWAAARLGRAAAYERRELFQLAQRRGYAFPHEPAGAWVDTIGRETALLERALAHGRVLDLRAPYPVDPRSVAAALRRAL